MGSHALPHPLLLAIVAVLALAAVGVGLALTLPASHPVAPAHFQGV